MTTKKLGRQTVALAHPPSVAGHANVVGKKEGEGPLADSFDQINQDDSFGEKTWEKAETAMQKLALSSALDKAGLSASALDYILAGDLLNQCIGSGFAVRGQDVPFFGLYGACSTMAESLSLAALLLDGGFATHAAAMTSSHFCSAERQYRTPLEYGGQRTPTAQWTVTGAGCVILSREGPGPYITHVTTGKIVDKGIQDANNMGAAMAPAAYDTIQAHFRDTGRTLDKAGLSASALDYILAGDLLNQCIGSGFAVRGQDVPFFGLYGACSTMAESLSLAALLLDGGFATHAAAMTSSHFCSAERQYRTPLEYGGQRTPTAQWTVTGAGCVILSREGPGPYITHVTTGKIVDKGIQDANNMGAAMAPAAYDTIQAHFRDTGRRPSDYDLIVTGDLGSLGKEILLDLFHRDGIEFKNLEDCGVLIYDAQTQDVHCGGSGCGCSAAVLTGFLLNGMKQGRWRRLLFCGTGALLSPTSTLQGESIPSICHAVAISTEQ